MKNSNIIVSGLPRSGTSMLMRIMEFGGLDVIFDTKRSPDKNNPNGFYETQNIRTLIKDKNWLLNNQGKVFKLILQYLPSLPRDLRFDIIYIHRSLIEISSSMFKFYNGDSNIPHIPNNDLIQMNLNLIKEIHLMIDYEPNFRKLDVNYNELIKDPKPILEKIKEFLNLDLDLKKMKSVIDPNLYRNRIEDISKVPYSIPKEIIKRENNVHI